MGAGISSPFEGETQDKMQEILTQTLKTFGEKYGKSYSSALVKNLVDDFKKQNGQGESKLQLTPASKEAPKADAEPLKTGWMTKEGAVVKSWKKRFFVLRPNYTIEYFDKEETFKSGGAPKGTINPSGYAVTEDPVTELTTRLNDMAVKLKVEPSKPKTLPPITLGLMHPRRRDWFIQFESEEQKQDWIPFLKAACKNASASTITDPVERAAFDAAFASTRTQCGYLDSWNFQGSETQNLSDLITRQLHDQVLNDVLGSLEEKIPNAKMRGMVGDKVDSTVDSTLAPAISGAWGAAQSAVRATRSTIESGIKPNIEKAVEADSKIQETIQSKISGAVDGAVSRVLKPAADVVLPVVMEPVAHSFKSLQAHIKTTHADAAKAIAAGEDDTKVFRGLFKTAADIATYKTILARIGEFNKLVEVGDKIPGVNLDSKQVDDMMNTASKSARSLYTNAVTHLQNTYQANVKSGKDKPTAFSEASADTESKLAHDCGQTSLSVGVSLLSGLASPPIKKDVLGQDEVKSALETVQEVIPDFLKDFVNLEEKLDGTVDSIIDNASETLVKPTIPGFSE